MSVTSPLFQIFTGRSPLATVLLVLMSGPVLGQPAAVDPDMYRIIDTVSSDRIENDIRKLAGFGTRNTFSDTLSETRGIGAARRWIKSEFEAISAACGGCLEVFYHKGLVTTEDSPRIAEDTWIVNVVAVLRGSRYPDRFAVMSGDIDSRNSDGSDGIGDAPGANDNASGMAGVIEAARVLSAYRFPSSIMFVGLSGEEQGLWGGTFLAETAVENGWEIVGVLNNDMIGNIEGIDGVIDNRTFRIFSEAQPPTLDEQTRRSHRFFGWDVDGPSRQLARFVHRLTGKYLPNLSPQMIYRLDRFGRGGHHRPFNDAGFPGIRIMEAHENYTRQHQNLRTENGIAYGDVVEGVNFDYAANLTRVNAISLAEMAASPPAPTDVKIGGAVQPSTTLTWTDVQDPDLAGYYIYWRDTTAPQWQDKRYVGTTNTYTLDGIVIDNYFFGVASVNTDGNESVVAFPAGMIGR